MAAPGSPHDRLFRALLDDPERARALLRDHLPSAIAAELAAAPPEPVPGSFVDAALQGSQSDRLFRVWLRDGTPAYIYALLEHKSTPDPRTPIQVLTYMARIWDRHVAESGGTPQRLPAIIPIVIYHGRQPWTVPTSVLDWIGAPPAVRTQLAGLRYILRDLGPIADPDLAKDADVRTALAALKHAFDPGVPIHVVVSLLRDAPDQSLLEVQVLEYVARVYDMSRADLEEAVRQAKPHRWEDLMGTPAQEWIAEGKAAMLTRMLERRFGTLPPWARERIEAADDAQLDAWADALFDATSLEDALGADRAR